MKHSPKVWHLYQKAKKMSLHDALYRPRASNGYQWESKTPIEDYIRRRSKLREQNVMPTTATTKPWLLNRFISLFR